MSTIINFLLSAVVIVFLTGVFLLLLSFIGIGFFTLYALILDYKREREVNKIIHIRKLNKYKCISCKTDVTGYDKEY